MSSQDIDIEYFQLDGTIPITGSVTRYSDFRFEKHFHNHYTILYVEKGVNVGFTENRSYQVHTGHILLINPGDLHAGHSLENEDLIFKSLRIDPDIAHRLCVENEVNTGGDIYFDIEPISDPGIAHILSSILGDRTACFHTDEKITRLLVPLISKHSNQKIRRKYDDHPVERAHQYIHDNLDKNFSLDQLAKAAYISPFYLIRQFRRKYGLTPFQYLRNLRIEKAKHLLETRSISEVAVEVGFFDQSHFLKHFRKVEGEMPSRYTRGIRTSN